MAIATTPLGFQKPDGNELVRNGNDTIALNAQKSQELFVNARARLASLEAKADFTGDPLELNDSAVAETLTTGVESQAALEARLEVQVPPVVAGVIATDPTVLESAATMAASTAGLVPVFKSSTAYTAGQKVIAPSGDVVAAKVNFTSGASYSISNWNPSTQDGRIGTLESIKWQRGELPASTNLDTMYNATEVGAWKISTAPAANSITGLPAGENALGVFTLDPGIGFQTYRTYSTGKFWVRSLSSVTSHTWTAWKDLNIDAVPQKGNIANSTDLNAMYTAAHEGVWNVASSTAAATMTNLPEARAGKIHVFNIAGGSIAAQWFMTYAGGLWYRSVANLTGPVWNAWTNLIATAPVPVVTEPGLKHQVRANTAKAVSGGPLGTGGKPFIILRFDDWHTEFGTNVAPILQSYDMPCIMACTVDMVAASVGAAQIQSWHVNDGFQVVNHSYSHGPASTDAQLVHEIIESADAHETNMPAVKIHTWTMPGTGAGTPYGGYIDSTEEAAYNTTAGKLLYSRHGHVAGARGGWLPRQGGIVDGQGHTTFESSTVAAFQDLVNSAKKAGAVSLTMMAHPGVLGTAGKMSWADFGTCMAWLAGERDAGNLMVGTATGMLALDSTTSYRHNLLTGVFNSLDGWTGSGWTVGGGFATSPASTATLSTTGRWDACPSVKGGAREVYVRVRSSAANSVKVRLSTVSTVLTKEKTFAVPGDGAWHDLRIFFSVPHSADVGASIYINSTTGVTFDVQQANMYAV
ncbi:polysaccharide deacetylase family protein [Paenarthrobacter sp. NPDC056912]|uniref:polysaccharide deacetylase family protein n=1 Tax=Paenarthrobacter sp. NPDC056912 TaxID=3345965 RepID=UPI0036710430